MKISTKTRYALRFLLELATRSETPTCITTKSIAQNQGLSEKYLESIATKLRKAGYIKSVKGAGGGYILHTDPTQISIGNIMRLMEANFFQTRIPNIATLENDFYNEHVIVDLFEQIRDHLSSVVDDVTLADLIEDFRTEEASPAS